MNEIDLWSTLLGNYGYGRWTSRKQVIMLSFLKYKKRVTSRFQVSAQRLSAGRLISAILLFWLCSVSSRWNLERLILSDSVPPIFLALFGR